MPVSDGALYGRKFAYGLETTPGTAVAATRQAYLTDASPGDNRAATEHEFDTGDVNRVRAITLGPTEGGGSASLLMSADELIEWLLVGLAGGVTPTTPMSATLSRLWTFVPSTTLASLTLEVDDAAALYKLAGVRVNQFTFAGDVTGAATVAMELFGTDYTTLTTFATVAQRDIKFLQGYQTLFYVDAGATATWGTTVAPTLVSGQLMNWSITVNRNLSRVYTADNTLAANAVIPGTLKVAATFTFKATAAGVAAQLTAYSNETTRLVRVRHLGPTNEIETGFNRFVDLDMAGKWSGRTLSGSGQGVRTYEFSLMGQYDATNALQFRARLQNARTAAWA